MSTPVRRVRSGFYACAVIGNATVALPSPAIKNRSLDRLIELSGPGYEFWLELVRRLTRCDYMGLHGPIWIKSAVTQWSGFDVKRSYPPPYV